MIKFKLFQGTKLLIISTHPAYYRVWLKQEKYIIDFKKLILHPKPLVRSLDNKTSWTFMPWDYTSIYLPIDIVFLER